MHVDLDFDAVARETPGNVDPAHDGMVVAFAPDGDGWAAEA